MAAQAEPTLRQTSLLTWSENAPWFGGFSGAEVSKDGAEITLVTDKGQLVTASMLRDGESLTGLALQTSVPLSYADGVTLKGELADAEGLAMAEGKAFVSFEHVHRVTYLDPATGRTRAMNGGAVDFDILQPNTGLEALALHPDGTLYALPERSGKRPAPFPLFALQGRTWTVAQRIPRRGPFVPVGADFDDNGRLYVLERAATPLGFRTRIRRFVFDGADAGELTLLVTGPAQYDNLEALSVWRSETGQTRLTLVSDDNFLAIQRTQIVEFTLTD